MKKTETVAATLVAVAVGTAAFLWGRHGAAPDDHQRAGSIRSAMDSRSGDNSSAPAAAPVDAREPRASRPAAGADGNAPSVDVSKESALLFKQKIRSTDEPIDHFFVSNDGLDVRRLDVLTSSEDFTQLIDRLRRDVTTQSAESTTLFQGRFNGQPAVYGGSVVVDQLQCGSQICAASIRSNDPDALDKSISAALDSSKAPVYTLSRVPYNDSSGAGERLLFSIDPRVKGASGLKLQLAP